jgi:hypothetical protein
MSEAWDELLDEETKKVEKTLGMATRLIELARKEQKLSQQGLAQDSGSEEPAPEPAPVPIDPPGPLP